MNSERIIDRLDQYLKTKGLRDTTVQDRCGLANGALGNARKEGRDIGKKSVEKILIHQIDALAQCLGDACQQVN